MTSEQKSTARKIAALVGMIAAVSFAVWMLSGCSRSYRYITPDGAIVEIEINGGDSSFGSLSAVKTGADGESIQLTIENFTFEQKLAETISALAEVSR
jgi:hypothetical protein